MSKVVDFIKARLSEDETWALAASRPPDGLGTQNSSVTPDPIPGGVRWQWRYGSEYLPYKTPPEPEPGCVTGPGEVCWLSTVEEFPAPDGEEGDTTPGLYSQGILEMDLEAAVHIARHSPSRTISEAKVDRRLLQRCIKVLDGASAPNAPEVKLALFVIRTIATRYARHPEYDKSWRP
ncbi:MAG TPA: DUF6221 family protein [Stackebrandtia sp.]|uniref:DUF6221 family protein n=1 Tax=Stackebrandtia sp. TaxID=2023065 RepID=UPI002D642578|nr:DUF6221 family protein [Stackebrandtia sp.]HZE38662.1 DUF6221 family protein [Stackebrandtia sp.]